MILAIQRAYYLHAKNPSNRSTHIDLAVQQGLDVERFRSDLDSSATETELQRQVDFSRHCGVSSFPSLLLNHDGEFSTIDVNYDDHRGILEQIAMTESAALTR